MNFIKKTTSKFLAITLILVLSFCFNTTPRAATIRGFYYMGGDILITNSTSSNGFTGHAGIVLPGGNNVLHIQGSGYKPTVISISKWLDLYPSTRVVRSSSMTKASNAANWAKSYYVDGSGKNTTYRITFIPKDKTYTYCSEIVWQAYYYGAGLEYTIANITSQGLVNYIVPNIITPYAFIDSTNQSHNKFSTVYSVNW